jgi:predicted phosphodiesterase
MARRIAAISCTHSPFTPPETHKWLLRTLREVGGISHFVHLGDVFEASSASVHPNEHDHTLLDEYRHASAFLRSIREELGGRVHYHVTMGNHDDNLRSQDPRRIPKPLRDVTDFMRTEPFAAEARHWHWTPYRKDRAGCLEIGPVVLAHGFDAGQGSDELEALQFFNMTGAEPWRLFVRGHTHRPVAPTQCRRSRSIPLPWWYCNAGTCGPLAPGWMSRRDTSQWGAAVVVVDLVRDPSHRKRGRQWEARLVRMEDQ